MAIETVKKTTNPATLAEVCSSSPLIAGKRALCHKGDMIIVEHGPEAITDSGDKDLIMVRGTPTEIAAYIEVNKLVPAMKKIAMTPSIDVVNLKGI